MEKTVANGVLRHAAVRLVEACGGAELHWVGEPVGESLQGWYKSKTQARKAHAAMPPLKDGAKVELRLVLPLRDAKLTPEQEALAAAPVPTIDDTEGGTP